MPPEAVRIAVDIGGTFTDLILEDAKGYHADKRLTTHSQPAQAVIDGIRALLEARALAPEAVDLVLHGTTLATNALIERRGAPTALLTTQGHRDVLEMALENRFEQYDIAIDRPQPLVPRAWRIPIRERVAADGEVLVPLAEAEVLAAIEPLRAAGVTSVAVGYLHAYRNGAHEQLTRELLREHWPEVAVSLSSEVCPEIREYERLSTTCANAYVMPLMDHYLQALAQALAAMGCTAPIRLMTSGGGLTTLDTARAYPIRLVESGPAGGAMLAAHLARRHGADQVLSFDMGGTTAKLCLLDDGEPLLSRSFEVDRVYRFKKGSGLPVRIPVVEMVEIGAGGGSIAHVDALKRLRVGPESAGSEPGPVAYGRGGSAPTVTDADLLLGRVSADGFRKAGLALDAPAVEQAFAERLAALEVQPAEAAFRLAEVVDENMAAASTAHASEWGRTLEGRLLIAFGGAAPVHALRLADKLGIDRVLIPANAGVGSALGFLLAPVRYEVVRSRYEPLSQLAVATLVELLQEMRTEAAQVVEAAGAALSFECTCAAYMRYAGQGFEIAVPADVTGLLDAQPAALDSQAGRDVIDALARAFEAAYVGLYGRSIPGAEIEIMSWTLTLSEVASAASLSAPAAFTQETARAPGEATASVPVTLRDSTGADVAARAIDRALLGASLVAGPLLVTEAHTTTFVPDGFAARALGDGSLLVERQ
ncbi:MAG: hydantoinase/oxoprolinase family protein [Pseudomonadota bacterium]